MLHLIETYGRGGAEVLLAQALPQLNRIVDVRVRALGPPDTLRNDFMNGGVGAETYGTRPATDLHVRDLSHRLQAHLSAEPVDIVHTHLFKPTLAARLVRLRTGRRLIPKLVTTLHNPDYSNSEAPSKIRGLARQALDWSSALATTDRFIAVSHAVADDFRAHMGGVGPWGRIDVIHNAMDVDAFAARCSLVDRGAARQARGWSSDEVAVLSIGRLTGQKDYDSLIDAISLLRHRGVRARAVVIGDGVERDRLTSRAHDGIHFHGRTGPDKVAEALVACDVYVQPSRWEAFGMAILEAMAASRPVVATAVDGIREVMADGETGQLVPPGNPEALATAIESVAADAAKAHAWGAAGLERARRLFGLEPWVDRTLALYRQL